MLTQTKKTGTVAATRKGGLGKSAGKNVKRFTAGTMKPGRSSSDGDTKIKNKPGGYKSFYWNDTHAKRVLNHFLPF